MMDHAFHHVDGRSALRLLWRTLESWFFSVFAGFLLIVIRQNILPPPVDLGIVDRLDALTLAAVVIATAMIFIRGTRVPLSLPGMSVGRGRLGSVECSRSSSVQPLDPRTVCDAVLCGGTSGGFHG